MCSGFRYSRAATSFPPAPHTWSATCTVPEPRQAAPGDESGRGLTLVAALADAWGTELREGGIGKTVWFELAC
ncbi:ATP-binding protein [Streptomyces sp. NPDC005263]|uniref:ATP-binding protein n=1 Tax=Streptomyces sp. NPDC005263 TaxID=3364711 RepID=UPI00369303FB